MVEKEASRNSFKDFIGCAIPALLLMAMVGGCAFVGYEGRVNYANAVKTEEGILKDQGLSGAVPLIDNQGYFNYFEVKGVRLVKFNLEVRGNDGITQRVEVRLSKDNIKPVITKDPSVKPTVLFKPDNFVKQNNLGVIPVKRIIPSYTILNGGNPKVYNPIGEVTIFLSNKDYSDFREAK